MAISRSCQPARARAVLHAADGAARGSRGRPPATRSASAGRRRTRPAPAPAPSGLKRADPGRRKIPRHAADGETVAAIGRDRDLDHRIIQPGPGGIGRAHRRVVRQLDDAGMVVAEPHLARRQQHARAGHAADLAGLERDAGAGDEAARGREHGLHAGARVGRAAHHGHDAHRPSSTLQARSRSAFGCCTASTTWAMRNGASAAPRSLDAFQLQADPGQGLGDHRHRGVGVEMRAQPGQGEFHRLRPPRAASPAPAG